MSNLVDRLRDADTTRRIGESYADTHERRQRDRDEAADRIEQLEAALRDIIQDSYSLYAISVARAALDYREMDVHSTVQEGGLCPRERT